MAVIDWDIEQGSLTWFKIRSGIPTASEFQHIITPKQMKISEARKAYQCRLIAERLMRWQAESLDRIQHIEDGKKNEPYAVAQLEEIEEIETTKVGFVRTNDKRFGCSPDRVAGINPDRTRVSTVIECKAPSIPKQMEYLLLGTDDAYRCQVQGQLWVAEADKAILYTYNPRMPACHRETGRDEPFLKKLADCLEQFSDELEEMTERAKSLGMFQAFAELVTPVEAERGPNFRTGPMPTDADIEELIHGPIGSFG